MWHIEDLLRTCKLDYDIVRQKIIAGYKTDSATNHEISEWYKSLIQMMLNEGITISGHLQMLINTINLMNEIHVKLTESNKEHDYRKLYVAAKPNIELFRVKSKSHFSNDIEICLNALYSLLLMRLSKKEISAVTMESMDSFSKLLAVLSAKYNDWEKGKLEI